VTKLDLVNNRLIPNAMEPRAAIGSYDTGTEAYTLYTTSQNPHVARLVISAFHGLCPEHKLRVIAPDVGGGFGSKIFIYAEEVVCVWVSKRVGGRPDEVDGGTHRELPCRRAWPRPCDQGRAGDRCQSGIITGLQACIPSRRWGPISRPSPAACRPISTPRCCRASTTIPNIYAEVDAVYTNTAPVDAYRGAGPSGSDLCGRTHR
jgi:carbon-monoxide dehydrogenase large subunit